MLYRVNGDGFYNVPSGKRVDPQLYEMDNLKEISQFFRRHRTRFYNLDYRKFLSRPQDGDFVYLDPPYDPVSESAAFTSYQSLGFNRTDQENLRDLCVEMHERGVKFMLSYSNTEFINTLYEADIFHIHVVYASRNVNSNPDGRGTVEEVLITNYDTFVNN